LYKRDEIGSSLFFLVHFCTSTQPLKALLKKELLLELRQKHALAGIAMYVLSTVFVCYLAFDKTESPRAWGALLWITGIFTAFNAMQKTFVNEGGGVHLYLYSLTSPSKIILAKAIYNAILVALLNVLSVLFFVLFFGSEALEKVNLFQFLVGIILGSSGLGLALTFISGLAYKSGTGVGMVAILGFPVIIPLLITIVRYTTLALEGVSWDTNGLNLLVLIVLNLISLILSYVLFPYIWRE
jgi:heme exporter protein B